MRMVVRGVHVIARPERQLVGPACLVDTCFGRHQIGSGELMEAGRLFWWRRCRHHDRIVRKGVMRRRLGCVVRRGGCHHRRRRRRRWGFDDCRWLMLLLFVTLDGLILLLMFLAAVHVRMISGNHMLRLVHNGSRCGVGCRGIITQNGRLILIEQVMLVAV